MKTITDLLELMQTLRDPETGCPWDKKQTMSSLRSHSLDEIYELLEAIDNNDLSSIQDELGDLLFHIVFYAQIASENDHFNFSDVVTSVMDKLHRRHPHVFADADISDQQQLSQQWESIKQKERQVKNGQTSLLDDVAVTLPETLRARKLQKRAASVGFDWSSPEPVVEKIKEELEELSQERETGHDMARVEEELGDILFSCVNLSRHLKCDPELALRAANRKFEKRFRYIEKTLQAQNKNLMEAGVDEMETLWQEAKKLS